MKALSVRQPWAWLIIRPDVTDPVERKRLWAARLIKDVENRTWPTSRRGRFEIHASRQFDYDAYCRLRVDGITLPPTSAFLRGGIIGTAILVGCVKHHPSPWFEGPWGFLLSDPQPVEFRPMQGALGFFDSTERAPTRRNERNRRD